MVVVRAPVRLRLGAAVLLAIGTLASPALAQDPAADDLLIGSLLGAGDLPAGFTTLGPEEGSDFDIDSGAFSLFDGRRVVSQAWASPTGGVVFDFRMQLPSAQAAADYLDEAEVTLSEADVMDLSLETDDPPVGDDPRHYTGVTRVGEAAITFDNYLFHVGPVAAKVFVGTVDLPAGEARRLAERAAELMAPFAALDPLDPGDAPPDPAADLLALVPSTLAASCGPFSSGTAGEVVALTCGEGDDLVVYSALADAAALASAFDRLTADMPPGGRAEACAEGPFAGPYPDDGPPLGRVACWDPPGDGLVLFWTDDANLVVGGILAATDEHDELDAAWQAARLP